MNKCKFLPNIWITFNYGGYFHIGRTTIEAGAEMIACVSEAGDMRLMPYPLASHVKQLKFLKDLSFSKYVSSKGDGDFEVDRN
ncbi:MAG: hypothetical protein KBH01_01925 [Breznakibacter sp.]|nr:hypothetical protein [Breznakibacter sp.]